MYKLIGSLVFLHLLTYICEKIFNHMKTKIILLALLRLVLAVIVMVVILYPLTITISKYCNLSFNSIWRYFIEFFSFVYVFFWQSRLRDKLKANKS